MNVMDYNVGKSNYAKMQKGRQPWDIWELDSNMDPWRADIIKRVLRTKPSGIIEKIALKMGLRVKSRLEDYKKILHIILKINDMNKNNKYYSFTRFNDMSILALRDLDTVSDEELILLDALSRICDDKEMNELYINNCIEIIKKIIHNYKYKHLVI